MSTNTYILDSLVRHQIYLQRYSRGRVKEIKEALSGAASEIRSSVSSRRGLPEISSIMREVDRTISAVRLVEAVTGENQDLAVLEAEYMASLLDRATRGDIRSIAPELAITAATNAPVRLVSTTGRVTTGTIDDLVTTLARGINRRAVDIVRAGIVEGSSNQEIGRRLYQAIGGVATRRQAEAVAITATNHITSQARSLVIAANESLMDGEEYVATLDKRTTLICISNDGKIFPVNQGPIPPLHYRCRSIRTPKIKEEFGLSGLVGERPAVGSDGVQVVPGSTTYQSFLRRQSKEFQDDVLGPARAELWRSGKYKLENFVDSSGDVLTLDELMRLN